MSKITLYEVLKNTYKSPAEQENSLTKYGFNYDKELSTADIGIFYNPESEIMLFGGRGSSKLADIKTDVSLTLGNLKGTRRYKNAEKKLKLAREKYNPKKTVLYGHSLFGTIVSYLGSKGAGDTVYTFNKGATIGQKTRSLEKAYRTKGDIVSLASKGGKNVKTLSKKFMTQDLISPALSAHRTEQIQGRDINILGDLGTATPFNADTSKYTAKPISEVTPASEFSGTYE